MHPPKIVTFDVPAGVSVDNKGFVRHRASGTDHRRSAST